MLLVQTGQSIDSLLATMICFALSGSQNGTWRVELTSREVSASTVRWCFRDRKQGQRCRRHFKVATRANRKQERTVETD